MTKKKKKADKEATQEAGTEIEERSGGAEGRCEQHGAGAGATDEPRSLPNPRVRVEDVEVLRAAIESFSALVHGRLDDIVDALNRSLATTSDLRERLARIEVGMGETQRRVTLMEENQRPPAPAPDREAAARTAAFRWMLANQCRASTFTRPTAAIVGRVMHDERAFDERTSKSPQELFLGILSTVRSVFRLAVPRPDQEAAPGQDYVHLTDDIAAIFEERSARPKKKQSVFLNDELKPRLELLANSGLAREITIHTGRRVSYSRYLTSLGREVFEGWPEWDDRTGGVSLADEPMPPDPDAAGRPVTGAPATLETQPGSPPQPAQPQPSPPPPPSQAPAT